MEIEINAEARTFRVLKAYGEAIGKILGNAAKGCDTTELFLEKDIAPDVRLQLIKEVKDIEFLIVDRRPNQYTGQIQSFSGRADGGLWYYKVKV